MKRFLFAAVLVTSFGALALASAPQGKSQSKGRIESAKPETKETKDSGGGLVFGGAEIRIIKDWFASPTNLKGLPPGLAKKESLPPGLEKQLRRNGSLPPGLEKKIQPLPRDLEVRLPRLPEGQRRVVISGSVILMDSKVNKILDILADVF